MQKIIGAALLLVAAVAYGFLRIAEERRVVAEMDALVDFIRTIRAGIAHYKKPLPEIFTSYSSGILEENGFLALCRNCGIREAWHKSGIKMPEKMQSAMTYFSEKIGSGYREDELHLCDYTLEQFEKAGQEMQREMKNREKLYRSIPPLLALSLVLLFI